MKKAFLVLFALALTFAAATTTWAEELFSPPRPPWVESNSPEAKAADKADLAQAKAMAKTLVGKTVLIVLHDERGGRLDGQIDGLPCAPDARECLVEEAKMKREEARLYAKWVRLLVRTGLLPARFRQSATNQVCHGAMSPYNPTPERVECVKFFGDPDWRFEAAKLCESESPLKEATCFRKWGLVIERGLWAAAIAEAKASGDYAALKWLEQ